ncbi:putative peptidase M24 [Treponema primitia ZAS-2]|uniref:Putative peptidase M24 n=1 Tax=Treponema primitia (strain ATCC BAA-887 / DSM 12427 / ZAS-2) TaxID=545694 RepID=F5YI59_TREPZ|nr:Xaa-Pro peptidase family protein [Treponema primitia]AEF85068.1 putative peptidase M24 [Treponema primitia ZAS-2]
MRNSGVSKRYDKIKQKMADKFDVVVALSPENVLYFGETFIETQKSLRDRLAIAVLPLAQDPVMIACIIEENTVEDEVWIKDKRYYFEFKESPIQFLVDALKERGLAEKRIGIELDYLSAQYYIELKRLLPDANIQPCTDLFGAIRSIKEPEEITKLQNAGIATRKAFEKALAESSPGDLETDLSKRAARGLIDAGFSSIEFLVMGTGKRSILVHGLPQDLPLEAGELGRIDFGGLLKHYNSDLARTFTIGAPNAKHQDVYSRMCKAYIAAIESCKVGVPANTPFFTAKDCCEKLGLPFARVHEGHGLGLTVHEYPMLAPGNGAPLEENMVVCVEHALHLDGYRYHLEDLVLISAKGPIILTEPDNFNPGLLLIK